MVIHVGINSPTDGFGGSDVGDVFVDHHHPALGSAVMGPDDDDCPVDDWIAQ
jgi:hypothetical protein